MTRQTITTRKQLIGELTRAAELEHSAICQYLYAAHSLKSHPAEAGVTQVQLERVREWQAAILLVARGEMEHLGLVCNLLIALGADPVFRRPDFPHEGPSGTRFSLEPFSENALESFVELEASHDGGGVHELYAAIRRGLQTLNDDAVPLFVGNQDAQVCNRSIGLPRQWYDIDVTVVTDLGGALAAIDRILEAGACQTDSVDASRPPTHRERFEAALHDFRALRQSAADFDPVRPVVSNPCTHVLHDDACTPVDHPVTHHATSLFNAAYETMLIMLTRFYSPTEETDQERSFLGKLAFRPLMTVVMRPLAELLTRMPVATDNHAGRTAGPAFEVASDLLLPRDKAGAWAMILQRLRDLQHRSHQLQGMIAQETSPWAAPLAPRAAFLAENLEAITISFEHHIEMAAFASAFKRLMES